VSTGGQETCGKTEYSVFDYINTRYEPQGVKKMWVCELEYKKKCGSRRIQSKKAKTTTQTGKNGKGGRKPLFSLRQLLPTGEALSGVGIGAL
jgi:hypothetical protein